MTDPVVQANIDVHTRLAQVYDESEPQFRPENKAKVRKVLEELRPRCPGGKLLDLGCGTGFIIDLAKGLFDEIHGIDITPAMLERVDTSPGNIQVHLAQAEELPFEDASFDCVTSYSFLHHTVDYVPILAEAGRVLRPGGIFYVDEEPNRAFWTAMLALKDASDLPPILAKARDSVTKVDTQIEEQYGIPSAVFRQAEYIKAYQAGIEPGEFIGAASAAGFSESSVRPEWFLGQADVMHGRSPEITGYVEDYLRSILPASAPLFKYLQFILVK